MVTNVSVPCEACGTALGLHHRACPKCKAPMPRSLRTDLEARLAASDDDFRELVQRVERALTVVLVVGLLYVALAAISVAWDRTSDIVASEGGLASAFAYVAPNLLVGMALLACFAWSKRFALQGLVAALIVWVALEVIRVAVAPGLLLLMFLSFGSLAVFGAKLLVLVVLIRGVLAAIKRSRFLKRSAEPPPG